MMKVQPMSKVEDLKGLDKIHVAYITDHAQSGGIMTSLVSGAAAAIVAP